MIRVYTTPRCVQCNMTKGKLKSLGLEFETVDLSQSPEDLDALKELGYAQAPVVFASLDGEDFHWAGFRPDLLEVISARLALAGEHPRLAGRSLHALTGAEAKNLFAA